MSLSITTALSRFYPLVFLFFLPLPPPRPPPPSANSIANALTQGGAFLMFALISLVSPSFATYIARIGLAFNGCDLLCFAETSRVGISTSGLPTIFFQSVLKSQLARDTFHSLLRDTLQKLYLFCLQHASVVVPFSLCSRLSERVLSFSCSLHASAIVYTLCRKNPETQECTFLLFCEPVRTNFFRWSW